MVVFCCGCCLQGPFEEVCAINVRLGSSTYQSRCHLLCPRYSAATMAQIANQDVDVSSAVFTERMASVLRSLNSSINASIALLSISPRLTMVSLSTVSKQAKPVRSPLSIFDLSYVYSYDFL